MEWIERGNLGNLREAGKEFETKHVHILSVLLCDLVSWGAGDQVQLMR